MNLRCILAALCLTGLLAALIDTSPSCQAQKPQLVVQVGHTIGSASVSFSPDGRTLASGGEDGNLKLWDVASGQLLRTFQGHTAALAWLGFSPDGRTLASGNNIWDVETGKLVRTIDNADDFLALNPDGKAVASGGGNGTVTVWDVATGHLIRTLKHHTGKVNKIVFALLNIPEPNGIMSVYTRADTNLVDAIAFSTNGKIMASGGSDNLVKLWNMATDRPPLTLRGHTNNVSSVCFSPDGKTLASSSFDNTVKLWNSSNGQLLRTFTGGINYFTSVTFSPDGKTLASGGYTNIIKLWDISSGHLIRTLRRPNGEFGKISSLSFSPDGKTLASDGEKDVTLWDVSTGELLPSLAGHTSYVTSIAFGPGGKTFVSGGYNDSVNFWDTRTSHLRQMPIDHSPYLGSLSFSPDGKTIVSGSEDGKVKIWDTYTEGLLHTFTGHTTIAQSVSISPDGKMLASGSYDHTLKLWEVATGRLLHTLTRGTTVFDNVSFSPDSRILVCSDSDYSINLWDVTTGKPLHTLTGHSGWIRSAGFSPDGKILASASADKTLKLWNVATGHLLHTLTENVTFDGAVAFSPDGRTLASSGDDKALKIWDVSSGRLLNTFHVNDAEIAALSFSPGGKTLIIGNRNGSIHFVRSSGRDICTLYVFDKEGWAVVDPDGRFDGNEAGLQSLHYVVGLEPIDLSQLKGRYYEPGLFAKLMGDNKEPLRNVSAFDHVELYPSVQVPPAVGADGKLALHLTNQGGGIGRVQVFVNGVELKADARGPKPNPEAKSALMTVDVSHAPSLVPGRPNTVKIVTWNAEGYLSSRGVECVYTPPGTADIAPPSLYAIVVGIDTYASPSLRLTYPDRDAQGFAHALEVGARGLLGPAGGAVHLTRLNTSGEPDTLPPTRANIQSAFAAARLAKPGDIFVVYLAGHGVALPGVGANDASDLYCYLTQGATTGSPSDLVHDAVLRQQTTVSSEDLTDWIKQVPALKKVMILDTCAAGAAAKTLVEKRDIPSSQARALEQLKDRTGFYVLMGCAADAASYETSRYGEGLLTYALLEGIKGAALKDGQYVDVGTLFNYAVDEVPRLAGDIGGVQRPFVAAPQAASFDVGLLTPQDRAAIPLSAPRPMVLRPELVATDDDLGLEELLIARLRNPAMPTSRGDAGTPDTPLSFVDASDFPGALQPRGTYTVDGETVRVTLHLRRDGLTLQKIEITGDKHHLEDLVTQLIAALQRAAAGPPV